jgi:outer membrane beta-barrel protein
MVGVRQTSFIAATLALLGTYAYAQDGQKSDELFKDVEVRVIRQKYFQKSSRIELSASFNAVMNQAFIYSTLGNAQLGYHINEEFGFFGGGGAGVTNKKSDCLLLGDKFRIEPDVKYISKWYGAGINYTPIYGKYQLSSGDVLYFDWYFGAEIGQAILTQGSVQCDPQSAKPPETPTVIQTTFSTGQRFFISKDAAAIWNIKFLTVDPTGDYQSNILLSLGMSYFLL